MKHFVQAAIDGAGAMAADLRICAPAVISAKIAVRMGVVPAFRTCAHRSALELPQSRCNPDMPSAGAYDVGNGTSQPCRG